MRRSETVSVRRWLEADAGDTAALLSDSRVSRSYSIDAPRAHTWSSVKTEWGETAAGVSLTGVGSSSRAFIGVARIDRGMLEYAVLPELWGNGYGGVLVAAALALAVSDLHLDTVDATVSRANSASRRTLERLGFLRVDCARRASRNSLINPSALLYRWTSTIGGASDETH